MSENGNALLELRGQVQSMQKALVFLRNSLQLGTYANSAGLRTALLQWCHSSETLERIRPCQLEMERAQMMTGRKSTLSRKARERVKANTKSRKEIARPARPTRALQTSTRARTEAELDIFGNNSNMQKGMNHKKGKGESKHVDVVETNQPSETASTVSYPPQTPSTIGELSCNSNVEPCIMGMTINFVFTRRQVGAEYSLLDGGAQRHACPIKYPGTKSTVA